MSAPPPPAIEARGLTRVFGGGRSLLGVRRPGVHAAQDVSLAAHAGRTLGVVGESGCGKSTVARMLAGLDRPTKGAVLLDGEDVTARRGVAERARRVQYVFQDPIASLNPRKTIRQTLEAPMRRLLGMGAPARAARLDDLMAAVGLRAAFLDRHPHEFSGGQAQRIAIARALAAEAKVVVLDEPVSALDVSVQAQVLTLLKRLRAELGLTLVFISHDLAVVETISDDLAVMYFGRVVEAGPARAVYAAPRHPYTDLLLRSAPRPGVERLEAERGAADLPDPLAPPPGCAFAARCPRAEPRCRAERPELDEGGDDGARVACWRPLR
ncbi:oligopeptide/dipeptide ABC transporter ATP-binding protein [Rubrimonas cliftonensis]|uniref:Peptide/nickel transport system ATP-binding protein n=1 Tax=Rubrimonas cliftonensis TaxID=89524 RepID=A0A1H3XBP4_9RHOB|nr:oligopeptide/dipeptide ABC transporter ATP-binding protein [Rubrimonas cliftonensis]SDZ96094.1 peptide/nickel transport system ATP-binding protein [Rubrimonas cliftonensis]